MLLKSLYAMLIFAKNVIPSITVEGEKKSVWNVDSKSFVSHGAFIE